MQREQDITQEREEDLELRRVTLRFEILAITAELERRERDRNPRD